LSNNDGAVKMSDVTKSSCDILESDEARKKRRGIEKRKRWRERSAYNEKRRREYQAELQKVPDKNRAKVVQIQVADGGGGGVTVVMVL